MLPFPFKRLNLLDRGLYYCDVHEPEITLCTFLGWSGVIEKGEVLYSAFFKKKHPCYYTTEELNVLYGSPNIVRVIKSRRMRWAGHVERVGEGRGVYRVWWENLRESDHWGDPGADGKIILRWIFRKWDVGVWTGWSWLRIGTGGGHLWMR